MHDIKKTVSEVADAGAPPVLAPNASVNDAIQALRASEWTAVLIAENGRLVGIFTERDLLYRVAAKRRPPATTLLSDVMTRDPWTLGPDDCVSYAIHDMAARGYSNIPVVTSDGAPTGLLGVRDLMVHLDEVFDELEAPETSETDDPAWIDHGGG